MNHECHSARRLAAPNAGRRGAGLGGACGARVGHAHDHDHHDAAS